MFLHKIGDTFQDVMWHGVTIAKRKGLQTIVTYILPPQVGRDNGIGKHVLKDKIVGMFGRDTHQPNGRYRLRGNADRSIVQPMPLHVAVLGGQLGI